MKRLLALIPKLPEIIESPEDMAGLQQLVDQYIASPFGK
jgi:hypothetical protein